MMKWFKEPPMPTALVAARPDLLRLTRTDPCPQVRHRAHLLLAVLAHGSLAGAARATGTAAKTIARWRDRFLADGRAGLADQPRAGRPRRLTAAADDLLDAALATSPMDYGYPVATWGLVDLTDLLAQHLGIVIGTEALSRHLKARGYVYRRPRHDLTHRQDAEAVESAKHTLRTLEKGGLIVLDTISSTWTNAPSIAIPTWQRPGSGGAVRSASPPPARTNASPSSAPSTTAPAGCAR
jgi:transposase